MSQIFHVNYVKFPFKLVVLKDGLIRPKHVGFLGYLVIKILITLKGIFFHIVMVLHKSCEIEY